MRVRSRIIVLAVLLLAVSRPVAAQVSVGTCRLSSGSGTPEGVVVGRPCDMFVSTTTGVWYTKWTGTNTSTGWGVGHNTNARVNGNTELTGYVGLPGYVSQLTGWRIDNLGGADFRSVYADEGHYKVFIADVEQALAGGQIIAKSVAILATAFTCPALSGVTTLTVEDLPGAPAMQVFQAGDSVVVRLMSRGSGELFFSDCIGSVSSPSTPGGTQTWNFTRYAAPNGGSSSGGTITAAKSLALDYGTGGNGYYEVNAIDGVYGINSPYAQIATWTTAPTAANRVLRARFGNLRGITGVTDEYGAILGTYGGTGSEQYLRASSTAFETHNLNISMYSGATEVIKLDRTAPSLAIGNPVPTSYTTGTGVFGGIDAGVAKFRVGNPSGNRMTFDGATLSVIGNGSGITDINGGNITTNSINVGSLNATGFGDNVIKNGLFEGGTGAAAIDGWSEDGNGVDNIQSCCGTNGPSALRLDQGTGFYAATTYFAFPVIVGQTYRVSVDLWAEFATSGYDVFMAECDIGSFVRRCKGFGSVVAPDMAITQYVGLCAGALTAGWQTCSATYTPTSGATWASLSIRQATGTLASETYGGGDTTYAVMLVDNVEVQRKIGSGHIIANSLTALEISADAITASELAADSVTSLKILTGTIVASDVATATLTADKLVAGTLTANEMAALTITGDKIAAGTLTADKLSVSTLSAITANLGAVTAGSINVSGGGGLFSMNTNGDTVVNALTVNNNLIISNNVNFSFLPASAHSVCVNSSGNMFFSLGANCF